MPIERTFQDLASQLRRLQDALEVLRLNVSEDRPLEGKVEIADQLEDSILDQMALLDEGLKAAQVALKAVGHPQDMGQAQLALTNCQERFQGIERQFSADLVWFNKQQDLASLGGLGGEWRLWVNSVKQGIDQCRQPLGSASRALAACWQEIAEQGGLVIQALNEVPGPTVKTDYPKGSVSAPSGSFIGKELEGHTEYTWQPHSYSVQTDLSGGITGAQASFYAQARHALDQSLALLDGLYALNPAADPKNATDYREVVRTQLTELLNELGYSADRGSIALISTSVFC